MHVADFQGVLEGAEKFPIEALAVYCDMAFDVFRASRQDSVGLFSLLELIVGLEGRTICSAWYETTLEAPQYLWRCEEKSN